MNIAENMVALVGNTPLVRINRIAEGTHADVVGKLEFYNPCHSVKDRIGMNMIETALADGRLKQGDILVEPTSGNTGIGLAFVSAVKGIKLILTMPESMSEERKSLLKGFGAELRLTPAAKGMKGAIEEAERIIAETPNTVMLAQFDNPANPEIHRKTTAEEIWRDTDGQVDIFISGVGTGGTISGAGKRLKELNPNLKVIAVEPDASPVLSGGSPAPHAIQGIGAGFVPTVLDTEVYDEIYRVTNDEALAMAKRMLQEEGILCGISSGAIAHAAIDIAKRSENAGKRIVFIVCDTGERYLSTALFKD